MRKNLQIAAIALLVLLTALAAVTVQLYRRARDQSQLLFTQGLNQRTVADSLRNASDALQNLQIEAANYLLTGRADSLKAYRESIQDWQYELGNLNLLSRDEARDTIVLFSETGSQLVGEMAAIVSLYDAGSHDAALDRLRTGAAIAYRDKIKGPGTRAFDRLPGKSFVNSLSGMHRLMYCAGGLYLLGFSGLALLLYRLRTTAGSEA